MPEMNREEIAKLEALYASNPEGRVFTHLAEAYRKAGEFDRARRILEQGLEKHPAYASAHVVLGRVFADLNDIPQARASFRHVLELDPHNLVALRSLGELAREAGNTREALGYFQELQHQEPGNDEVDRIVEQLKRAPPEPEPEAAASPPPEPVGGEAAAPAEPASGEPAQVPGTFEEPTFDREPAAQPVPETLEALPGFESAQPDYGDLVSPDIDLGWTAGVNSEEEVLPGDLAEFANQAATPEEAQPATEELVSFDVSELQQPEEEITYETLESVELPEPEPPVWAQANEQPLPDAALADLTVEAASAPDLPEAQAAPEPDYEIAPDASPASGQQPEPAEAEPAEPEPANLPSWAEPVTAAAQDTEDSPPDDLVTETMGELLVEQGLHEAAADVYRALIRERPWDPDLKKRLAEIEQLGRPAPAPEAAPSRTPEPEAAPFLSTAPEAGGGADVDAEPDSPWMSAPAAVSSTATPYAWTEDTSGDQAEDGPPITDYFRSLLAWRPGTPAPAQAAEPEPEMANFEPSAGTADQPAILELETRAPDEGAAADQLMPWEAPEPPAQLMAPAPAPSSASPSENPVDAAFDEWFNASDETQTGQQSAAAAEESGEDDDDLEMFRSWLQSLKK